MRKCSAAARYVLQDVHICTFGPPGPGRRYRTTGGSEPRLTDDPIIARRRAQTPAARTGASRGQNLSPTRTARRAGADAKGGHDLPRHRRAPTAPDARTRNRPFRPGPPRRGPQRICSRNTGRPRSPTEHVHTVPCLTILFAHAKRKTAHEWRVSPCTWPPPRPRSRVEIP